MDDIVSEFALRPRPSAQRPLLGLTILVVEDSRFASEAVRLLSLRSGARIRRADCLTSARRHLSVYRPSVAIVDLGLPDGSGLDLIRDLNAARPRVQVILATSGAEREAAAKSAIAAGADGFLPKPLDSLAMFQSEILRHIPAEAHPRQPRPVSTDPVMPDRLAYREDLSHARDLLQADSPPIGYLRPFLIGVARAAHDQALEASAAQLEQGTGRPADPGLSRLLNEKIAGIAAV